MIGTYNNQDNILLDSYVFIINFWLIENKNNK